MRTVGESGAIPKQTTRNRHFTPTITSSGRTRQRRTCRVEAIFTLGEPAPGLYEDLATQMISRSATSYPNWTYRDIGGALPTALRSTRGYVAESGYVC